MALVEAGRSSFGISPLTVARMETLKVFIRIMESQHKVAFTPKSKHGAQVSQFVARILQKITLNE